MAVTLPNGSQVAIASGYGATATISVITNANPAVATLSASHNVVANDIIEVTSGWSRLNNKIVKAGTVATNDVQFLNINSTSTTSFPAGSGIGSVREISGWTSLSQVLSITSSGGDQQFLDYQFLEDDAQKRIPTTRSPAGLSIVIANDTSLAGYQLAETANDDRLTRAVRITLPNGAILYYNGFITLNKTPTLNANQIMSNEITVSLQAEPVRY